MKNRISFLIVFFACSEIFAIFAIPASAQTKWTLTTADFRSAQAQLSSLDRSGATIVADGASHLVKWDELLLLDREAVAPAPPPLRPTTGPATTASANKFILYLAGGDQFRGEPKQLENETLVWNSPSVGAMNISLKQVSAIARANQPQPPADPKRTEDVVTLTNGDSVRGILSGFADGSLKMQSQGNEVPVPMETVSTVMLAAAGGEPPRTTGRAFRVRLGDGSLVTASALRTTGAKLVLTLSGGERDVPFAGVSSIEQINGPVSWLSSRPPSENVQTPLLDTTRPARMDKTVIGKPIRFGDRTYARGIGVTPYSRLTWDLSAPAAGGNYKAFRTQYAIDGAAPYADVTVRVKLDGKVVHERSGFTAGELSPVVIVPLGGAKALTLEVDYGGNYNVQDRFNWIEPALVTSAAIPAPPAAPATPKPAPPAATTQSLQPAPSAQ